MAYSRSAVVKQAQGWIGLKESNGTHKQIIDKYNSHTPLARGYKVKYTDSWCATFVSAVAIALGYTDIIPTECSCNEMIKLFDKMGCWEEDDSHRPDEGDVIFYDWQDSGSGDNKGSSDHVGIVEKVSGTTITVIEGNKSNAVGRRTLEVNGRYIRGYGLPKYTESAKKEDTGENSGLAAGEKITLKNAKMYSSATSKTAVGTKTGTFYAWDSGKQNGRIRITTSASYAGKENKVTGWVDLDDVSDGETATTTTQANTGSSKPSYTVGKTYTLQTELNVRKGPGTGYAKVGRSSLTADGQKHDADKDGALDAGTVVTCKEVRNVGNDIWIRCPSGWLAAYYNGKVYIK